MKKGSNESKMNIKYAAKQMLDSQKNLLSCQIVYLVHLSTKGDSLG